VAGDADGDSDILWYAPGMGPDYLWRASGRRFSSERTPAVNGTYLTIAADLDANGRDDIVWYGPGAALDRVWWSMPDAFPVSQRSPSRCSAGPIGVASRPD
jgi:hypothetical protein